MIAQVAGHGPQEWNSTASEALLKICGQFAAYGADRGFLRFYEDEHGNKLSILDTQATLHASADTEEMRLFLTMDPSVTAVRTDAKTAKLLAKEWGTTPCCEAVMTAPLHADADARAQDVPLRDMYRVLHEGFGNTMPPFDVWYADAHHRFRRDLCRAVAVYEEGTPVAVAMTVAECETAALIGAVATLPSARGKGYASACVLTLSHHLQQLGKTVFLSPKNPYAHALYKRIGFTVVGEWGQVTRS